MPVVCPFAPLLATAAKGHRREHAGDFRVAVAEVACDGGGDPAARGSLQMRGNLSRFGYDAAQSSVIVRFDATLLDSDGVVRQQRFEAIETGVLADAASVGPALNSAANDVARQVADWLE